MQAVEQQKIRLEQKKNRLLAEETKLKMKERKMRTRSLIELGGLVVKAELNYLATNTLYGAILSLKDTLVKQPNITEQWTRIGKAAFDQEQRQKTAVILKLNDKPSVEIRDAIRKHSLKWNHLRQEWYGYTADLDSLKESLGNLKYQVDIIKE